MICAHTQIDIIARSPEGVLTLIEVKMQTPRGLAHVPHRQIARLLRAASLLAQCEPVELRLALVEENRVRLLPLDAI